MNKKKLERVTPDQLESFPLYRELPNGRKLVFIHINKTGGTSVRSALGLPAEEDWRGRFRKHYRYNELLKILPTNVLHEATIATIVRNPWDRLVSLFHYRKWLTKSKGLEPAILAIYASFPHWFNYLWEKDQFRKPNIKPQISWLCDDQGQECVDFIGKFENLEQDTHRLSELLGISPLKFPHLIKSTRNPDYRSYYTPELREKVAHLYRADIERFDYHF
jgi:hypothetical protein